MEVESRGMLQFRDPNPFPRENIRQRHELLLEDEIMLADTPVAEACVQIPPFADCQRSH